ncbi:MAG: transcriptional repressor CopY [Myxococcaceae bacterium]|nr:transcriptional repressor CopY [Myxococcaceae bacterium]
MALPPLTDVQLALMKSLWKLGQGSVADVQAALADQGKQLAPTTVATMLLRLAKQGWVSPEKVGRQYIYRASVDQDAAATGALQRVVRAFFGGSVSALTAQLLDSDDLTAEELEQMRSLIRSKET